MRSYIDLDFIQIELIVMSAVNFKLTCCKQAGGDELTTVYRIYKCLAISYGLCTNPSKNKPFSLGLFLLYLSTIRLSKFYSNLQIACACLHLSLRMIQKKLKWPSYLESISQISLKEFFQCEKAIATLYVDWFNNYHFKKLDL